MFFLRSYPSSPPHQQEPASLSCGRFQSWWPPPEKDLKNEFTIWVFFLTRGHFPSFTPFVYLCSFRSPVHFHTQVVSISLPVQFAVDNIEEVADADLLTGRQLHQSHSGWDVFVLRYPECYDVVTRRPWEVPVDTDSCQYLYTEGFHNFKCVNTRNKSLKHHRGHLLDPVNLETLLVKQAHRLKGAEAQL